MTGVSHLRTSTVLWSKPQRWNRFVRTPRRSILLLGRTVMLWLRANAWAEVLLVNGKCLRKKENFTISFWLYSMQLIYWFQRNDCRVAQVQWQHVRLATKHDGYHLKFDADQYSGPIRSSSKLNRCSLLCPTYQSHWNVKKNSLIVDSPLKGGRAHINCFSCNRSRMIWLYSVANTLRNKSFLICKTPLANRIVTSPSPAPISVWENKDEIKFAWKSETFYLKLSIHCLKRPVCWHRNRHAPKLSWIVLRTEWTLSLFVVNFFPKPKKNDKQKLGPNIRKGVVFLLPIDWRLCHEKT